ncbi:MAG TPA: 30S ribosomal protein S20 [Candidatus Sulfotelmatobacter sp.]|nr:30S ribosomal protein S20 [Candidatus Sulfotelmatobacter sp.]
MPIIKSAKKRVKVSTKARVRNAKTKRSLRTAIKTFKSSPSAKSHSEANSQIDRALKKGVIHKNKAARLKRRASKNAKASGVKVTKTTKKAPVAKKTASKKK